MFMKVLMRNVWMGQCLESVANTTCSVSAETETTSSGFLADCLVSTDDWGVGDWECDDCVFDVCSDVGWRGGSFWLTGRCEGVCWGSGGLLLICTRQGVYISGEVNDEPFRCTRSCGRNFCRDRGSCRSRCCRLRFLWFRCACKYESIVIFNRFSLLRHLIRDTITRSSSFGWW